MQEDLTLATGTGGVSQSPLGLSLLVVVPSMLFLVFNCCVGAVTDGPEGEPPVSACQCRHQHRAPQREVSAGSCPRQISFSFHPFSPSPNLLQDNSTGFTPLRCEGSSLVRVPAERCLSGCASLDIVLCPLCFDLLGSLLFAIAPGSLGMSKQFIQRVYYLPDGQ